MNGTRYNVSLFGTPKLGNNGLSFVNLTGDYRTYLRLGRNYSIALRFAGGGSFGRNPQKFIIGGVDNWINRTFETGYVPWKTPKTTSSFRLVFLFAVTIMLQQLDRDTASLTSNYAIRCLRSCRPAHSPSDSRVLAA